MISRDTLQTLGNIVGVTRQSDGVTLSLNSGAVLRLTFLSASVIRVRFVASADLIETDWSYAVNHCGFQSEEVFIEENHTAIEILTMSGIRVIALREGCFLSIFDETGELVVEDFQAPLFDAQNGFIETAKRREPEEFYFGFGEKAKSLSVDSKLHVMWNTDTYAYQPGTDPLYQSIPFFIAVKKGCAYGIFFDNTYRCFFDMGDTSEEYYRFGAAGGELNYYIFTGGRERSPQKILRDYTSLTGRCPLPPHWALGYQQSRWSYCPEARVRELAHRFREKHIPADVIYLDIDYMNEFRVFTWDRDHFPDPKSLISDLKADGFRLVIIIDPGIKVDENYFAYRSGRDEGSFCRTSEGDEFQGRVWPGTCAFPDFTNPSTRKWFGNFYEQHLDEGVSGFWNDMNEPSIFPPGETQLNVFDIPEKTFPLSVRHDGDGHPGDHGRYHNIYGMQMARTTYEAVKHLRSNRRPFVLTRAGFAGVQRYAAVWTGDNVASWEHLALSIPMLCNMNISGVPFVGSDVGGFAGEPSGELFARWLQAAALTPFCRSHAEIGTSDQEPWSHGEQYEAINRASIELRYQLLPFLYSLFHEHEQTGTPVMRPLWFDYPHDEQTYEIEDQFLVGSDLLVAPVIREGAAKRTVYFPNGSQWRDWMTGILYEGGSEIEIDAPIDRLPLFIRVGAALPAQPVVQHTGEMSVLPLTIIAASGTASSRCDFYEDAGDGFEYQNGDFSMGQIVHAKGSLSFKRSGAFNDRRRISHVEFLGLDAQPQDMCLNGKLIENMIFNKETGRLIVALRGNDDEWMLTYS